MTYCDPRTANRDPRTANCELRTANSLDERKTAGFSLIEVLVATALLVMIVGMIGFVFRQSSMSWDSGTRRADGISQIRAVVGAIERDLRLAVDAREFKPQDSQQKFEKEKLIFIALADPDPGTAASLDKRGLMRIEYSGGKTVKRTATRLKCSNGQWGVDSGTDAKVESILLDSGSGAKDVPTITFDAVFDPNDTSKKGLPVYVNIEGKISVTEKFSGLTVRSKGPDEKGAGDDIVAK